MLYVLKRIIKYEYCRLLIQLDVSAVDEFSVSAAS